MIVRIFRKNAFLRNHCYFPKYREYFLTQVPEKYRDQVDVRAFSPGKRIVFEPYTKEVYDSTHQWMESINIFPEVQLGHAAYEDAILV